MVATSLFFVAASSIFSLTLGAPLLRRQEQLKPRDYSYSVLGGDGTEAQGWPAQNKWLASSV